MNLGMFFNCISSTIRWHIVNVKLTDISLLFIEQRINAIPTVAQRCVVVKCLKFSRINSRNIFRVSSLAPPSRILGNSRATQFETDRHWNAQRGKMIGCYKRKNSEFVWFRFITFPNRRRFVIETFLSCDFDEVAAFCRHFSLKRHRFLVNRANFSKSIVMESLWLRYKVAVELRHKVSKREKKNGFQRIELRRQSFTTHRLWLEMLRHNRTFFKRNFFSTFDLIVISFSSPCSNPPEQHWTDFKLSKSRFYTLVSILKPSHAILNRISYKRRWMESNERKKSDWNRLWVICDWGVNESSPISRECRWISLGKRNQQQQRREKISLLCHIITTNKIYICRIVSPHSLLLHALATLTKRWCCCWNVRSAFFFLVYPHLYSSSRVAIVVEGKARNRTQWEWPI